MEQKEHAVVDVKLCDSRVEWSESTLVPGGDLKILAVVLEKEHEDSGVGVETGCVERCLPIGVADV